MRQTALAMNIHRNTLSNRLQKIETLTGINLSNAQQRLSLQIALIAARFIS
ncbi:helix-turn-helix domain-containing protein [Psychrobacter sp. KH172YL61]|uniref:helix-turn-helix domain-containing protein n=2 Tax=Moraxellaceae TaxID=468 RepID=UPI003FA74507